MNACFGFKVQVSYFQMFVNVFTQVVFRNVSMKHLSYGCQREMKKGFELVRASGDGRNVIHARFRYTIGPRLFFVCPIEGAISSEVLLAIFDRFTFTITMRRFCRRCIIIACRDSRYSIQEGSKSLLESTIKRPFGGIIYHGSLVVSFREMSVVCDYVEVPMGQDHFHDGGRFLAIK